MKKRYAGALLGGLAGVGVGLLTGGVGIAILGTAFGVKGAVLGGALGSAGGYISANELTKDDEDES